MKITVRLFVQRLADNTFTITAPAFPSVSVSAGSIDKCRKKVVQALAKRLSYLTEDEVEGMAARPDERLERVEVELQPRPSEGSLAGPLRLAIHLLVSPREGGALEVGAPRLTEPPLSFTVADASQLESVGRSMLILYFQDYTAEQIESYQPSPSESLDQIDVEFRPSPLQELPDPGTVEPPEKPQATELNSVGIELTARSNEHWLSRAYGRETEVARVLGVLGGIRPSLVLLGPSGVGKTAILHEVVRQMRRGQCAESLRGRAVWSVTGSTLLAGQKYIGEWEGRLQKVIAEVRERHVILFVEDIAGLIEAGRHEQSNTGMADYLRPYVQNGSVVIAGESTPERWRYAERQHPGFVSQFTTVRIEPTDEPQTLAIVNSVVGEIERRDALRFVPGTAEAAVGLTDRFLPYRSQPGKAVRLVEQTASDYLQKLLPGAAGIETGQDTPRPDLGRRELVATFTRETGLPEFVVAEDVPLDLAVVRRHFAERVVGQEDAVDAMVDLIALIKTGLNDPEKPLGSFLFIGPTGVGKTQMVKTLAKYLFGDEERVIRFDMSEYADPFGVRRLIGSPGTGEEGELTGRVREQPFCVLLLDEFEKAAPQVYDLFLQVLGEGRLTGATGATTSFQNAIVVMTSNLGASARDQRAFGLVGEGATGGGGAAGREGAAGRGAGYWQNKVEEYFRPEFVNRIDQIVPFQPLGAETMRQIARRELGEVLLRQGVARRNLLVEIDDGIIDLLLEQGFSAAYGARPLKRAIEQRVVVPLARFLAGRTDLSGELLRLGRDGDRVSLAVIRAGPEEPREQGLLAGQRKGRSEDKSRLLNYGDLIDDLAELRQKLDGWARRDTVLEMRNERDSRLARTSHPTFWDDPAAAQANLARFYFLERLLKRLQQLTDRAAYLEELARLVDEQRDAGYRWDLAESFEQLTREAAFLEVELLGAHIVRNRNALLSLTPMPRAGVQPRTGQPAQPQEEETLAWVRRLAAMYISWADRKGYDLEAVASLVLIPEAQRTNDAQRAYPYRWQRLDVGPAAGRDDCEALVKAVSGLDEVREVAILLSGANVYGFLKGEAGLHRRGGERSHGGPQVDDERKGGRRPKVERVHGQPGQQFVAVAVDTWDGEVDAVLEAMLRARATGKSERGSATAPAVAPSEIVRNYHVEGPRYVRDPRTRVRHNDLNAVLAGDLDEFILAYLREIEPGNVREGSGG